MRNFCMRYRAVQDCSLLATSGWNRAPGWAVRRLEYRKPNLRPRRGFSLVELLVAIGILVILVSILLPYAVRLRETDNRARCADNLRILFGSLQRYAALNGNNYPRVTYEPGRDPNGYVAYTGSDSADPFARGTKVKPNDVSASLWLLVRLGLAEPKNYICASTSNNAEPSSGNRSARQRSNFSDGSHLSYSYSSPFSTAPLYKMNDTLRADFAVMADKSPGIRGKDDNVAGPAFNAPPFELARANSNNHERAGQNVLYAAGLVTFQPTPYCGVGTADRRDNIYTALALAPLPPAVSPPVEGTGYFGPDLGPSWSADSYLVPTDDD